MERYVIGQDFNTKDWFIYDNETGHNVYWCGSEEEAIAHVKSLECLVTRRDKKILEPGDRIRCQGITCTIAEITFQEYWEDDGFYIEFRDETGVYRNWKQWVDGGEVLR